MIEVRTRFKNSAELNEISEWLNANVGKGHMRFRKNTWMGTDDWFFYQDYPEPDEVESDEDLLIDDEPDVIFVFRREEDASLFSLKWL